MMQKIKESFKSHQISLIKVFFGKISVFFVNNFLSNNLPSGTILLSNNNCYLNEIVMSVEISLGVNTTFYKFFMQNITIRIFFS